jgi:HD-GYP domain-containing protein (c-di-GMP phosphodiesterase class II)/DNA-binding CsgD family transcriptional regulator
MWEQIRQSYLREESMDISQTGVPTLRLAELIASLSLALDLGLGQPMENFLHTCLLAVRLGTILGVDEEDLVDIYYLALIERLGCIAYADDAAAIFGDDITANSWLLITDQERPTEMLSALLQHVGKGESAFRRTRRLLNALVTLPRKTEEVFIGQCEVGQRLAERIGLRSHVQAALGQIHERWDGKGLPNRLNGEAILLSMRVVRIAQDAEIYHRLQGRDTALAVLRQRAGGLYDPLLVDRFCQHADQLFEEPDGLSIWEAVLAAEPGRCPCIPGARLDEVLRAVADFVDLKSPYTVGHSSGVAELAAAAARRCGLPEADVIAVQRAGLLHDLGRIGVSNAIWDKPGPLSEAEWERVRLHPYYTERVLARLKGLGQVCAIAPQHHERLDGSGYHRGLPASMLPMSARILAAADIYHALTEPRPHRAALSPEEAAAEVRRQVRAGRLDGEVVNALLVVAGHRIRSVRRAWIAGLSDREIEVLRLIVRGQSNRQIASRLSVSERTVEHHVEHIYSKIGVSTRAGATLFAMEHHLLSTMGEAEK